MAERVNIMNKNILTASKNPNNFDLFEIYLNTVKSLKKEMRQLFNTGIDTEKGICSMKINKEGFSYVFKKETIESVQIFLDTLLDLKEFPKCKFFQEFLFEESERYSLCSCYPNFAVLNDIEIFYVETLAIEEL